MKTKYIIWLFVLLVLPVSQNLKAQDKENHRIKDIEQKISIEELNRLIKLKGADWVAEENKFTEMSLEERRAYLGLIPCKGGIPVDREKVIKGLRSELDWRNKDGSNWMTLVKSQGNCGSCWAFAAVGAFEAVVNVMEGDPSIDLNLSEQTLVSQCCDAGDCNGGFPYEALVYIVGTGLPLESCFPYQASNSACNRCQDWLSQTRKAVNAYQLDTDPSDIDVIKQYVVNHPIGTGMAVYTDFFDYGGGIYEHVSGVLEGYHAIVIVGWNDTDNCWIAKNSWGAGWGESGYFRIRYANSEFGISCSYASFNSLAANAGIDTIIAIGDTVVLSPSATGGSPDYSSSPPAYQYSWSPDSFLSDPNTKNPETFPTRKMIYWVTVQDLNGTSKVDSVIVNAVSEVAVYPGDTDNDGIAKAFDILPIGRFWGYTGDARDSVSTFWGPQVVSVWDPDLHATFADCNGDGIVDIDDVLAIGQNWHKTHTVKGEVFQWTAQLEDSSLVKYIDNYREIYNSLSGGSDAVREMKSLLLKILHKYGIPEGFHLSLGSPNVFHSHCIIEFALPGPSITTLDIYDKTGRLIRKLLDERLEKGYYSKRWDGKDNMGSKVSAGVYFARLAAGNFVDTKMIIRLR